MANSYLEWTDKNDQIRRLEIIDKVFIGRGCLGIEEPKRLIIEDPAVSRDHAIISMIGSRLQITDMSRNGIWINDVRMAPGSSQDLKDGDIVRVGKSNIRVGCPEVVFFDEEIETTRVGPIEMIVTSLVAEVRGFSGMLQRKDLSQVYAEMKGIFETLAAIVRDQKGTIKDYVGDAVYAF